MSVTSFDKDSNPCPYFLEEFISKRRFNAITRELRFTNTNPPPYVDKFWKILQMVKAWNDHMAFIFLESWKICLDESMSIWNSRWKLSDDPIEAGVFNASNWAEEIALVRNQGLEVDDDMRRAPENVPLFEIPAADTLFEG